MPRPEKQRIVCWDYKGAIFKPRGVAMRGLGRVQISKDEMEALRLCYSQMLYQEQAAEIMGVSRQTVSRIVNQAMGKITDALLNGKALEITGGNVVMKRKFTCADCGHMFEVPYGIRRPARCPDCKSVNIHRSEEQRGFARRGRGQGLGRGRQGTGTDAGGGQRQYQSRVRRNQQQNKE